MLNILQHTPLLAWLILAGVVVGGFSARQDRVMPLRNAVRLPVLMLLWSLWRQLATPDFDPSKVLLWFAAATLALAACRQQGYPRGLLLDPPGENLYIPGSWLTPVLMMLTYCAQFSSAILHATRPELARSAASIVGFALVYGSVSGIFMARLVAIWQLVAHNKAAGSLNEFSR